MTRPATNIIGTSGTPDLLTDFIVKTTRRTVTLSPFFPFSNSRETRTASIKALGSRGDGISNYYQASNGTSGEAPRNNRRPSHRTHNRQACTHREQSRNHFAEDTATGEDKQGHGDGGWGVHRG